MTLTFTQKGKDITIEEVVKTFYRSNGKAVTMDAADLVQEVSALISVRATLGDLHSVIHIHPTLQELL